MYIEYYICSISSFCGHIFQSLPFNAKTFGVETGLSRQGERGCRGGITFLCVCILVSAHIYMSYGGRDTGVTPGAFGNFRENDG